MPSMICVAGEAGAGKTTLVRGVLSAYPQSLEYLTTYTTRPPRGNPLEELGYIFVTKEEYEQLRRQSTKWDHGEYYGNWYGADVAEANKTLERGRSLIVTTMPDPQAIHEMAMLYGVDPITIYIKTAREVRLQRLLGRSALSEATRLTEDDNLKMFVEHADQTFEPVNSLAEDVCNFNRLIGEYIK